MPPLVTRSRPSKKSVRWLRFEWGALDEWLEEDEPIYTHPRDPYTRVDILHKLSTRRDRRGRSEGCRDRQPTLLFETGCLLSSPKTYCFNCSNSYAADMNLAAFPSCS